MDSRECGNETDTAPHFVGVGVGVRSARSSWINNPCIGWVDCELAGGEASADGIRVRIKRILPIRTWIPQIDGDVSIRRRVQQFSRGIRVVSFKSRVPSMICPCGGSIGTVSPNNEVDVTTRTRLSVVV